MDLNKVVGYSLRAGVLIGALLSLLGLVSWGFQGFGNVDPVSGSAVVGLLWSSIGGNVAGVVYLGVILLIATPIFRVAISVVYFGLEKDREYVGITLLVLAMLVFSVLYQAVA